MRNQIIDLIICRENMNYTKIFQYLRVGQSLLEEGISCAR